MTRTLDRALPGRPRGAGVVGVRVGLACAVVVALFVAVNPFRQNV